MHRSNLVAIGISGFIVQRELPTPVAIARALHLNGPTIRVMLTDANDAEGGSFFRRAMPTVSALINAA